MRDAPRREYVRGSISIGGTKHLRVASTPAEQSIKPTIQTQLIYLTDVEISQALEIASKMSRYLPGLQAQPWGQKDVLLVARALKQVYDNKNTPPMIGFEE